VEKLASITYRQFLEEVCGYDPQVGDFYQGSTQGYFGVGIDACSAIDARANWNPGFDGMDLALAEMASLGLPLHVTELDVNGAQGGQQATSAEISENADTTAGGLVADAEKRLADQYANMFRAFVKHKDSIKMVTLWGVNDGVSWRANGRPLLFDGKNQPKPAFDAVLRVAREAKASSAAPAATVVP